jgi:hypothetical protein
MSTNEATLEDAQETLLGLEDLENTKMEDIEDAPGFLNDPPVGLYILGVKKASTEAYVPKKGDNAGKKMTRIKHIYEVVEIVDLEDKNELIPPVGSLISEAFGGDPDGRKYWKFKAKAILNKKDLGTATIKEVCMELTEGSQPFKAKVTVKKSKGSDGTEYSNVQVRVAQGTSQPEIV